MRAIAKGGFSNAKGTFRRGDVIEGSRADLQPLVDSGSAVWEDDMQGPLDGIDLTERAGEIAMERGLTVSDFEGREPSGETGFTVADVRQILADMEE